MKWRDIKGKKKELWHEKSWWKDISETEKPWENPENPSLILQHATWFQNLTASVFANFSSYLGFGNIL